VIAVAGSRSDLRFEPLPKDDPTRRRPDISKAKRLLGWEPKVNIESGLQKTLAWFANEIGRGTSPTASWDIDAAEVLAGQVV
jgi:nucleoside-diphosphate-sugar epimerase